MRRCWGSAGVLTGVFCHFPTSAVAEVAGGAGEEGGVLGPVPGTANCQV